jgi:putative hydrolase of the HAD superfamily
VNLVFDLGGVVLRWDPEAIASGIFPDEQARMLAREHIFFHADWLALDRGTLTREDAIARGAARTGLPPLEIERLFDAVPPSLVPIPETVALLHRLHGEGHLLYCISNIGSAGIDYVEREHDFFRLFRGTAISCRLNFCKPEPEIYQYLLRTYTLRPAETVFIDDLEDNVRAAASLGMRTVRFENAAQCERELRALLAVGGFSGGAQ